MEEAIQGRPDAPSLRRGRRVVRFLRAVARLPKGHGIIWRLIVPLSPRRLRRIVCDPYGFYLHLDLSQLLDFEYALGTFDKQEIEFLLESCQQGSVFLDIGANQGFYSLYIAHNRPAVKVLAFEPDPYSLDKLRRNVRANGLGNITICPYALSDTDESKPLLLVHERNRGASSLLASQASGPAESIVEVPCRPLLDVLREHGVREVGALKIDVEGYEYPVLRKFFEDAPRDLYPRAIVVEALGDRIAAVGGSPIELLFEKGYRIVSHNRFNFLMKLDESRRSGGAAADRPDR